LIEEVLACGAERPKPGQGNVALRQLRVKRLAVTRPRMLRPRPIGKELRARHTELLNGLTPAERHGLTIGLAGIARVLKNQH
jgi:hypothetical protein